APLIKIKMDLFATSCRSPSGPSATPMFAFGNPAWASGSPLRGLQDDELTTDIHAHISRIPLNYVVGLHS
ncbi:MAG: hypothetical protein WBW92_06000, partial [Rhodanobacteraceae bacterium]